MVHLSALTCSKKYRTYIRLIFAIMVLLRHTLPAQDTSPGIPFTRNFSSKAYEGGTQNWAIHQHRSGILLIANNNGLLQYDGDQWNTYPLPNRTVARSVYCHTDGRIFVGGQNEFGYFQADTNGLAAFHSLLNLVPEANRTFADVWEICFLEDAFFFRTSGQIFRLYEGKMEVYPFEGEVDLMEVVNGKLYINEREKGLHLWQTDQFKWLPQTKLLAGWSPTALLPLGPEKMLITTLKNGIFQFDGLNIQNWATTDDAFLKSSRIYTALQMTGGNLAIGTSTGGLLVLDTAGVFRFNLNRKNGLQNNNILSLFSDRNGNLWLGLDDGIDFVQTNSAFSRLFPDPELRGPGYAAYIYKKNLYLGTSDGLYTMPWNESVSPDLVEKQAFRQILQGQTWGIQGLQQELFVGAHEGALHLTKDGRLEKINQQGTWLFAPLGENKIMAGAYFGLEILKAENGSWSEGQRVEAFKESARFLVPGEQPGVFWVSHPYRGIFKVSLDEQQAFSAKVRQYGPADGLPSNNLNHVFAINKQLVFTGESGVFQLDTSSDKMVPHQELEQLLGRHRQILRFFEDREGHIWFVSVSGVGRLRLQNKGVTKNYELEEFPELKGQLLRGFEMIYPYDAYNVFIGAENGFIHFNPSKEQTRKPPLNVLIHQIAVHGRNSNNPPKIFGQTLNKLSFSPEFSHREDALIFRFSSPHFELPQKTHYQTRLLGQDDQWSEWSDKTEKEYNNIAPGDYQFEVRAKNEWNQISETASFNFSIRPPWYASNTAIAIYLLALLGFLGSLVLIPRKRFRELTAVLQSEHQKEIQQSEQEINYLRNKNLENELLFQQKELASATMHLVQKNELIQKLKQQLQTVTRQTNDHATAEALQHLIQMLNPDEQLNENWDQFALHFDRVHSDFLKRLQQAFPQLSSNDLKLSAYLRMNLSTKEIAQLMNITVRGVEVGRYRLRKKLEVDTQVNLNEFMMKF